VDLALDRLGEGDSHFLKGYLRAGMSLSSIPGEEERGRRLILESTDKYGGPLGHVLYGLLVEDDDPQTASEHFEKARARWPDGASRTTFEREVDAARAAHRLNVRRLAAVS
jgi:hypothetical protein